MHNDIGRKPLQEIAVRRDDNVGRIGNVVDHNFANRAVAFTQELPAFGPTAAVSSARQHRQHHGGGCESQGNAQRNTIGPRMMGWVHFAAAAFFRGSLRRRGTSPTMTAPCLSLMVIVTFCLAVKLDVGGEARRLRFARFQTYAPRLRPCRPRERERLAKKAMEPRR